MKRSIFFSALGVLVLALVVTACGPKELTADKAEFIVNNAAEPQTLDPSLIQGVPEHRIYMALFEGLTINDPKTSKAVPGIAESWKVSEDGTVVTFKLRKSQWSDGTPLTAKHFVDGWIRTLKPETAAEYAYMMYVIKGAEEFNQGKTTDPATEKPWTIIRFR